MDRTASIFSIRPFPDISKIVSNNHKICQIKEILTDLKVRFESCFIVNRIESFDSFDTSIHFFQKYVIKEK